MVNKDAGLISAELALTRRFSCSEKHPGLCFTKDAGIYQDALQLASSLEKLAIESVGRFLLIEGSDQVDIGNILWEQAVFACEHRARRSYAPQAMVFAWCSMVVVDEDCLELSVDEKPGLAQFDFASVWTVAKAMLRSGGRHFSVSVGCTLGCEGGP